MDTTHVITTAPTTRRQRTHDRAGRAESQLRWVLRADAATSILAGGVAAVAPSWLDELLGTGHPGWIRLVGVGLLVFAAEILVVARSPRSALSAGTRALVAADVAWVAATVATIVAGWYSTSGAVAMAVVGLAVADIALVQHVLRRRMG